MRSDESESKFTRGSRICRVNSIKICKNKYNTTEKELFNAVKIYNKSKKKILKQVLINQQWLKNQKKVD